MRIVDVDIINKKIETKIEKIRQEPYRDFYMDAMADGLELALQILKDNVTEVKGSKRGAFITHYIPLDDREDEE